MKVNFNGIQFDSDLEVEYYKKIYNDKDVIKFKYHPSQIKNFVGTRSYTPDFIVEYADRIEVVETKGYNQFSAPMDTQIHEKMKTVDEWCLAEYCDKNGFSPYIKNEFELGLGECQDLEKHVIYRKIKYLKAYGWVDFEWKNPNTIAKKRKDKINELEREIKGLSDFKKNVDRYYSYLRKLKFGGKLTKSQRDWMSRYELDVIYCIVRDINET